MESEAQIQTMEQSIEAQKKISADIETKIAELEKQMQDGGKFVDIGENKTLFILFRFFKRV